MKMYAYKYTKCNKIQESKYKKEIRIFFYEAENMKSLDAQFKTLALILTDIKIIIYGYRNITKYYIENIRCSFIHTRYK